MVRHGFMYFSQPYECLGLLGWGSIKPLDLWVHLIRLALALAMAHRSISPTLRRVCKGGCRWMFQWIVI